MANGQEELVAAINAQRGGAPQAPAAPQQAPQQDPIAGIQEIIGDDNTQNTPLDNAMDIDTLGLAVLMLTQAVAQIVQLLQGAQGGAPQPDMGQPTQPEGIPAEQGMGAVPPPTGY